MFFAYALDRLAGNPVKLIKLMLMKFRDPHYLAKKVKIDEPNISFFVPYG
jgi:hypothetical protein